VERKNELTKTIERLIEKYHTEFADLLPIEKMCFVKGFNAGVEEMQDHLERVEIKNTEEVDIDELVEDLGCALCAIANQIKK